MPHLISLTGKYREEGLRIPGLNLGFAREHRIDFPLSIADNDMLLDCGVQAIPTIFVIDREGVLVEKDVGYNPIIGEALEKTVKTLPAR